jgi:uncharacterized protein YfiM (DUF2279 family)
MNKIKYFLALALTLITLTAVAQEQPLIPIDKQYHLGAGAVFGVWGTLVGNSCMFTPEKSALIGLASATVAGIGKELWDEADYRIMGYGTGFDWKDLGATMIGGVIGTALTYTGLKIFYHYKSQVLLSSVQGKLTYGIKINF